jgi:hypothetical protein
MVVVAMMAIIIVMAIGVAVCVTIGVFGVPRKLAMNSVRRQTAMTGNAAEHGVIGRHAHRMNGMAAHPAHHAAAEAAS